MLLAACMAFFSSAQNRNIRKEPASLDEGGQNEMKREAGGCEAGSRGRKG